MTAAVNRNRLIARLHVVKRDLGLDEDTYRDKLEVITGKRSAAELSDDELVLAANRFQHRGSTSFARLPATKQARFIQAQWISLYNLGLVDDPSDGAILAFIRRQTKLDAALWLKRHEDVVKVAEALKDWMARDGGVDWKHDRTTPPTFRQPGYKVCLAQWKKLLALGAVTRGVTWTGNPKAIPEGLIAYAETVVKGQGPLQDWTNAQWARVSKALGKKLRAAMAAKETAA